MSTTQNQVTDALTEAIKTIADSSVQSKDATLTIEAEIVDVIDEGLGTYTVKYLGNRFNATTAHTEVTYEIGDMVYVVVPNGNFDKNKVILAPVNPSIAGYAMTAATSSGNTYINISENLFNSVNDISMSTWKPIEPDASRTLTDNTGFISLFNAALKDSRTFNLTCKIRTEIEKERRSKGDYGLELHLPVLQDINGQSTKKDYVVKLNVDNIIGDPYNLQAPALQNIYFTLPDDMSLFIWSGSSWQNPDPEDIPWIGYFVRDFDGEDNTKPDDIFITDIQLLSALEISEENMPGYYSVIKATNGNSFLTGRTGDEKTLSVLTFLNGKQTKNSDFACYWFKENVGINKASSKYHRLGEQGWEILNKVKETNYTEDGKPIYEYITDDYTQKVLQNEIHCDTVYKCILAKNINTEKPIIITSTITIKNLQNDAIINLVTENGSTVFSKGIGNVVLQLKYYEDTVTNVIQSNFNVGYYWQKIDKFNNIIEDFPYELIEFNQKIIEDNKTFYSTKIKCPVNDIDEISIFKCTVYLETNREGTIVDQIVGTASIMITTGQYLNGHIEVINGDKLYKYDADGNSPMADGQYSGPLSDFITAIEPISIRLYKGDGNEFTSDEYAVTTINWLVPVNSMIALTSAQKTDTTSNPGYYTISGLYNVNNNLNYGIATTYSYDKTDNTIIIKASTPSTILKETISEIATLTFLKDGEGGTNGSSYSAVITYNGYSYGENGHKLQLIYVAETSTWYIFDPGAEVDCYKLFDNPYIDVDCYLQGDIAYPDLVKFSIFDEGHEKNSSYVSATCPVSIDYYSRLVLNGNNMSGPKDIFCAIIQAEVVCTESAQRAPTTIYAYYPIECIYLEYEIYLDTFIPYFKGGFSKVLYGSDGTNPKYDQKSPFKIGNYYCDDIDDLFTYGWDVSPNIKLPNVFPRRETKLTPVKKFDNGISNNYVRTYITAYSGNLTNITNKINSLNIEKTRLTNEVGYYQELQENLIIFTNFNDSFNSYKNMLLTTMPFYSTKTGLVKTVEELLNKINQLQNISNEYRTKEDGTTDSKVETIYSTCRNKTNILNRLNLLCGKLGVEDVINQIKVITPENLTINKILYSGLPERNCYYTINNYIDLYNSAIEAYSTYFITLNDLDIISQDQSVRYVITQLNNFVESPLLDNLTKTYYGHNDECYKYLSLIQILTGRVESASKTDIYSYNLITEGVLQPMYDDLVWYISFTNGGGYTSKINEINIQINEITEKINYFTFLKDIITEMCSSSGLTTISCCRPVVMTYNRYEMSFLNGWDGNKLNVGDGYLIAPQIGAGIKNGDNSFTGIVLGTKQIKETQAGDVGLFGYNQGIQTIFLNARNGSASFGEKGAGQIILDPSSKKAIIKSGNYNDSNSQIYVRVYEGTDYFSNSDPSELGYWEYVLNSDSSAYIYVETTDTRPVDNKVYYKKTNTKAGMMIDLTTPEIKFGTGNFAVTKEGHIIAKGGGSIAGWEIDDYNMYSTATGANKMTIHSGNSDSKPHIFTGNHNEINSNAVGFFLSPDGLSITGEYREPDPSSSSIYVRKSKFQINTNGNPKIFSGGHETLNSELKGFYLSQDGLSIGSKVYINDTGLMRLGYKATDPTAGNRRCWTIDGSSSNSSISYGDPTESSRYVYIGTDEIRLGKNDNGTYPFYVTNKGKLYAKNADIEGKITASSGTIGGWSIDGDSLKSQNSRIKLNATGSKTIEGADGYYIDLGGGGDFPGCHINASKVVFSVSGVGITSHRGDSGVFTGKSAAIGYTTDTGLTSELHFVNGILVN